MALHPNNVHSLLAVGDDFEHTLFQLAISFAENGLQVWFISPKAFDKPPPSVKTPDREILQLITFMYLKDHTDLVRQLNGVHMWRKTPDVVLISGYEHYCGFSGTDYDQFRAALVTVTVIDGAAACATKKNTDVKLLVTCQTRDCDLAKLQGLRDLYFTHYLCKRPEGGFCEEVMSYFNITCQ